MQCLGLCWAVPATRLLCKQDSPVIRLSHAAAEMADLREAVKELRGSVNALAANVDPAQEKILKTNLRDARASAALRVQQLSTSTTLSVVRISDPS